MYPLNCGLLSCNNFFLAHILTISHRNVEDQSVKSACHVKKVLVVILNMFSLSYSPAAYRALSTTFTSHELPAIYDDLQSHDLFIAMLTGGHVPRFLFNLRIVTPKCYQLLMNVTVRY